jgi:hypothetical protein
VFNLSRAVLPEKSIVLFSVPSILSQHQVARYENFSLDHFFYHGNRFWRWWCARAIETVTEEGK